MSAFDEAMRRIDAVHAEDPATVEVDGAPVPAELAYARRMSAALARLVPAASEALRLAVRAQHLKRWDLPRDAYPGGAPGYHRWRTEQKRRHAALAAALLDEAGIDGETAARVGALVQKKGLGRDEETQALEDAACLVFLERELTAFAEGRDEAQLVGILQKTWRKMSPEAHAIALALPLDDDARALVERALAG